MRYEWKDTGHGPQLWDNWKKCWAIWYGIGAIGLSDKTKQAIEMHLNGECAHAMAALCGQVNALRNACVSCGHLAEHHNVDDEERRECAKCDCQQYKHPD